MENAPIVAIVVGMLASVLPAGPSTISPRLASGKSVRVAVCQMAARDGKVDENLAAAGAKLCVFPELVDVGFGDIVKSAGSDVPLAQPIPGRTSRRLGEIARRHGVWLSAAILERVPGGAYDTNVIVDSTGHVVHKQRKAFVYPGFAGTTAFQGNYLDTRAVDSPWGPLAVVNCADIGRGGRHRVIADQNPSLLLVNFANPQANLLARCADLARRCSCPVVGANMVFASGANRGGRSQFVARTGGPNSGSLNVTAGGYAVVPHSHSLNAPSLVTVALWVKVRRAPLMWPDRRKNPVGLVGKGKWWKENYALGLGDYWYLFGRGLGGIQVPALSDVVRTSGRWHHVAVVLDAHRRQGRLYVDGVLHHVALCGAGPSRGVNGEPLCFGRFRPKGLGLNGLLDDVRLYTRALSEEEIARLVPGPRVSPPLKVAAGTPLKAAADRPVALNGSCTGGSPSPSSRSAAWTVWRKLLGPGQAQFDNAFAPATNVRFTAPGRYLLELRCSDGTGVAWDTLPVEVSATPGHQGAPGVRGEQGARTGGPPDRVFFSEGFDDPNVVKRGWYDAAKVRISAKDARAGGGCIEYEWADGGKAVGSRGLRHLFKPTERVYLRFYIKLSRGWRWSGRSYHPHMLHFLTTENSKYHGPARSHLTLYVEANGGKLRLGATDMQNAGARHGLTQGPLRGGYNGKLYDSRQALLTDANWHCVEAMFKLNSVDSGNDKWNADGELRGWLDGKLVVERTDVVFRTADFPKMKLNQLLLAPYFGPGLLPHAQKLWIDELAVGTRRIGPLPASGSRGKTGPSDQKPPKADAATATTRQSARPGPFDGRHFKGRIAWSADGNFNDADDWAASPVALAILARCGVADRLVHFDYNCILARSDPNWEKEHERSVLGAAERGMEAVAVDEGLGRRVAAVPLGQDARLQAGRLLRRGDGLLPHDGRPGGEGRQAAAAARRQDGPQTGGRAEASPDRGGELPGPRRLRGGGPQRPARLSPDQRAAGGQCRRPDTNAIRRAVCRTDRHVRCGREILRRGRRAARAVAVRQRRPAGHGLASGRARADVADADRPQRDRSPRRRDHGGGPRRGLGRRRARLRAAQLPRRRGEVGCSERWDLCWHLRCHGRPRRPGKLRRRRSSSPSSRPSSSRRWRRTGPSSCASRTKRPGRDAAW
jgi:predicted amidohydrolase